MGSAGRCACVSPSSPITTTSTSTLVTSHGSNKNTREKRTLMLPEQHISPRQLEPSNSALDCPGVPLALGIGRFSPRILQRDFNLTCSSTSTSPLTSRLLPFSLALNSPLSRTPVPTLSCLPTRFLRLYSMYNISYSRPFLCLLSLLFLSFSFPFVSFWARSVSPSHIRLTLAGTVHPQFPDTSKIFILSSLPLDSLPTHSRNAMQITLNSL